MFHKQDSLKSKFPMLAAILGAWLIAVTGVAQAAVSDEIRARLQPAGELCQYGEDCAAGMSMAGAGSGEPMAPADVYQTYCFACHGTGANDSPVMGNAEHWAPRIAKGIDTLYQNAIEGFNNGLMPAMGLCATCSEDDIKATVDYILADLDD